MKINRQTLKRVRKDKLWSQEQLAEASGLSLRTIQRIESSGSAAMDSLAAIASALETDKDTLLEAELNFIPYEHTQMGYFMWVVSLIMVSVCSSFLLLMPPLGIAITLVAMLIPAVLFFSLRVAVSEETISWHFGPGFWRKELPIEDIASCEVVNNSVMMGFGIRLLGDGWMYNVSGLLAVEIRLKSGSAIRLGSDEPNYLKEAIDNALALQRSKSE
ncbi:helix-turn-helix transcriptional regulator [Pseudoteredinibacter isoporae]|nr:helix-turn-helix transcriptional regulator [Pseudoteredinibacter isoporae]NIB26177.1 helix-turn-helix transcriptional regulator [Pseudoteredinibacter isoporae]